MSSNWDVLDLELGALQNISFDFAIFACGYEVRSNYLASVLEKVPENILVLGFSKNKDDSVYSDNKSFYMSLSENVDFIEIDYSDVNSIVNKLSAYLMKLNSDGSKVLVDYSSMPRLWFSEILSVFTFFDDRYPIEVVFSYSVGLHSEQKGGIRQLGEPFTLSGCESVSLSHKNTVALFCLGFDEGAPLCLFDKIEPKFSLGMIAKPGAQDGYAERAYETNKFLITNYLSSLYYSPLNSVRSTYFTMKESIFPHLMDSTVVLVPFGPKPHALAAMIIAMETQEVSALYASTGNSFDAIEPTGELVISSLNRIVNNS